MFHLHHVARCDNEQYGLSNGFRGYEAIFFECYWWPNFSKWYCCWHRHRRCRQGQFDAACTRFRRRTPRQWIMDSMGYQMGSAGTKRYVWALYCGKTSEKEALLSPNIILLWIIYFWNREDFTFNCRKNSITLYYLFHGHRQLADILTSTASIHMLLIA